MQILSDQEILEDIEAFQDRISALRQKVNSLPSGHLPYPAHKKREKQRRNLEDDIQHVQKMIEIAQEARELPFKATARKETDMTAEEVFESVVEVTTYVPLVEKPYCLRYVMTIENLKDFSKQLLDCGETIMNVELPGWHEVKPK